MACGVKSRWGALAVVLVLAGCATGPKSSVVTALETPIESCRRWYADLGTLVAGLEVNDAQDRRIPGFPQLRQSRFLASFRSQARQDGAAFDAWFARMRSLGDQGNAVEIANMPERVWRDILPHGGADVHGQALLKTRQCADLLDTDDRSHPDRRNRLLDLPGVPDDYSTLARFLGVYAATRWPFSLGVQRWQEETKVIFDRQGMQGSRPPQRYVPEPSAADEVVGGLASAPRDALGIPELNVVLRQRLLDRHAPLLDIAPEGGFDRFGAMGLDAHGAPRVDPDKPTVYRRIAFARQGDATLVQLVYLYWFSERPKTGPLDVLGGALDGVMWRVTLDEQGQPLIYDSAHACGCYHLFFPTPALRPRPSPEAGMEWAFVPAHAPRLALGERVVLGLAARTHYLNAVSTSADFTGTPYASQDALQLRSLPLGLGMGRDRRSLFGPDGIVPGTQRGERYFFWPMGIKDAGAQRQWGHHATAFVGRRHFDDPDLIERRFERVRPGLSQAAGSIGH